MITFQYYIGDFQLLVECQDCVTHTLVDKFAPSLGEAGTELEENDTARGVHTRVPSYHSVQLFGRRIGPGPRVNSFVGGEM